MSGFNNAKLDEEFFPVGKKNVEREEDVFPTSQLKSNFLCNLGYATPRNFSRAARASTLTRPASCYSSRNSCACHAGGTSPIATAVINQQLEDIGIPPDQSSQRQQTMRHSGKTVFLGTWPQSTRWKSA
jgi:hypothetical protein